MASKNPLGAFRGKAWKIIALSTICLALGALAGFDIGISRSDAILPLVVRENSDSYKFINPILIFTIGDKENFPEYKPLEKQVVTYINNAISTGKATNASVYFRNLTDETWTGVNENEKYAPSSMLKVAVLIAYLKLSETDPTLLAKSVYYEQKIDPGQYFKPKNPLKTGWYTNAELLKNMIDESDNVSVITLISNQKTAVTDVYKNLQLPLPKDINDVDFMSARLYSRLFRVLYNGTYLSKELSEKALALLSGTDFNKGIINGVPTSTTIAHKFGERSLYDSQTGILAERQLHDCGIVYQPNSPYFVCIMTRGKDFNDLESVISGISSLIYQNHRN